MHVSRVYFTSPVPYSHFPDLLLHVNPIETKSENGPQLSSNKGSNYDNNSKECKNSNSYNNWYNNNNNNFIK